MEQTFSERLKRYRRDKNLTQQELADLLGVSNKTVSRWESEGGYPDIPLLVPLARALGVTVDDLLDGERPIRALSRADWQSLLSFAFALGGGVLFYLLDLFMPMALCWCAYLGCMAYGVYLQKYYAYQSRWFQLSNALMCFAVNLTFAAKAVTMAVALALFGANQTMLEDAIGRLLMDKMGDWVLLMVLVILAVAAGLTVVIQRFAYQWSNGRPLRWREGAGAQIRPTLVRPPIRRLLPGLVPWLAAAFWLLFELPNLPEIFYGDLSTFFYLWWLILLAVAASLPLLRRGYRRWLPAVWVMTALCWGMVGLRVYKMAWSPISQSLIPYQVGMGDIYQPVGQASWAMVLAAAALCALWLLLQCVRLSDAPVKGKKPADQEEG